MAKKKRFAEKDMLLVRANNDWDTHGQMLEADDSDNGIFLDDDTEDFLPSAWTGKTTKSIYVTTNSQAEAENQLVLGTANLSVTDSDQQTTACENSPSSSISEQQTTITVSRLQVPASLVRQTQQRSEVEKLRAQIKALQHSLAKQERDSKSAKVQAAAAHAKLEAIHKQRTEEIIVGLRSELREVQGECRKATSDLRKERSSNDKLRQEKNDLAQKIQSMTITVNELQKVVVTAKSEKAAAINNLQATLIQRNCEIKDFKSQLMAAQTELDESKDQDAGLKYQLASIMNSQDEAAARSRTAHSLNRELERKYDRLKEDLRHEKRTRNRCIDDIERLEDKLADKRRDLESANSLLSSRDRKITSLVKEIASLKKDRDLKEPLVKIATQIRLRFLEQAREIIFNMSREELDLAMIQDGNNAAHRADGDVDAALFEAYLVPDEYWDEAQDVFYKLYEVRPSVFYYDVRRRERRLRNCIASVHCVKSHNDYGELDEKRLEYMSLVEKVQSYRRSLSSRDFDTSENVEWSLTELEEVTDEIIQLNRRRDRRRG